MLFSFRRVSAFLWLVCCWLCSSFIFFIHRLLCSAKKINVLHCGVGKRQKNALAGGNTAKGLCVLAFVCRLKPLPCLWVGLYFFTAADEVYLLLISVPLILFVCMLLLMLFFYALQTPVLF